ncbi:MAG: tetratricopeptide repeat protein [Acidobacteria bacterium]|nr:tetratricopeptide repeat protein [Acidobacteriota bacterium]
MHVETIIRGAHENKAHPPRGIPTSLAIILLAAAHFRAIYFFFYARDDILFGGLILDSAVYDSWAVRIAAGEWLGLQAFYFPPLYPYVLGVLFRAAGHSLALVYLLQALLGLVSIVLIHRIGAALFGPRAGILAAAGAALYGPFAFYETKVLGTTLGLTLDLTALALLVGAETAAMGGRDDAGRGRGASGRRRGNSGRWVAAGLVIGVASACLPGTVLLAPLYAASLAWRRATPAAVALLLGTVLGLLPVTAHNLYAAGDFLPLSGQGGTTFYQGNHPNASGMYNAAPGFSGAPETQATEEQAIAERDTGRAMRRSETSAHFFQKGLAWIASSPGAFILLEARKLAALLGDYEAPTEYSLYYERDKVPWLRLLALPFAAIAGAGVAGVLKAGRPHPPAIALSIYSIAATATPLIFYVSSRYRLPLVPALLIYGAHLVDTVWAAAGAAGAPSRGDVRALILAGGLALVSFFPLGAPRDSAEANVLYNVGNLLAARGRHEEAIASFDRSVARWAGNAYAWINRGNSLDRLGREDEALGSYRRAEEENPGFWTAYKAQGIILHRKRLYAEEETVYRRGLSTGREEARYLLGVALKNQDRLDEAARELEEATRLNPAYARAHTRLGEIYAGRGDTARARERFRLAVAADPGDRAARAGLARLGG